MNTPRIDLRNITAPPGWMTGAVCAQTDPELFYPGKGGSVRAAQRICAGCAVRTECRDYALERGERFGVWGGLSERQRHRLRPVPDQDTDETDPVVVARLAAGHPVPGASGAELARAAVELYQTGHGSRRIAERLRVHDRQVCRWLARYRAGQPLSPAAGPGTSTRHRAGAA